MSDAPSVPPVVQVVGMGLSGVESLAPAVLKLVQSATLIIGAQRLLDTLGETNQTATVWPLGNLAVVIDSLRSHLSTHPDTRAVILTTGDPLFFGLGRLLLAQLPPEQLAFHPQVSSIQLAFSRLKLPWQDATLLSVHGRGEQLLIQALKQGACKIAVLTDGVLTPKVISNLIQSLDLPVHYQLWVCENLGGEEERVRLHCDEDGVDEGADYAALNVLVLLRLETQTEAIDRSALPLIGLPDSVFYSFPDRPLLITKREIRLLILGAIAPLPHQTIWDIGAGTGSVSVELSRLCPSAQIYAIEKTAIGVSLIRQNVDAFAIAPVHPIHAKAPASLADLPMPDRVFIGGSSGQLTPVLNYLNERMASCEGTHGDISLRIVLALATVEHLHEIMQWAAQPAIAKHWQSQLTQINISRSLPVGPLTRFSPLNPVTLVTLQSVQTFN